MIVMIFFLPRKAVVTTDDILEPSDIWYLLSACRASGALHNLYDL